MVETLLFLGLLGGLGYWICVASFRQGKREGSRKAYGVGREHERHGGRKCF